MHDKPRAKGSKTVISIRFSFIRRNQYVQMTTLNPLQQLCYNFFSIAIAKTLNCRLYNEAAFKTDNFLPSNFLPPPHKKIKTKLNQPTWKEKFGDKRETVL